MFAGACQPRGTYVVKFAVDGPVFVDATPDLGVEKNGLLAAPPIGKRWNEESRAEWNHGEAAFR